MVRMIPSVNPPLTCRHQQSGLLQLLLNQGATQDQKIRDALRLQQGHPLPRLDHGATQDPLTPNVIQLLPRLR